MLCRALGDAERTDYVEWATARLARGDDTPNLRILAGLSPTRDPDDIEPYFRRACADLSIVVPEQCAPLQDCAQLIRRSYEMGKCSAAQTIRRMADLYRLTDYADPLLGVWMDMDDEIGFLDADLGGYMYPRGALSDLDAAVRREWHLLDRGRALNLDRRFRNLLRCVACGYVGEGVTKPNSFLQRLLLLRRRRVAPRQQLCGRCGTDRFESLSDPDVRSSYFDALERAQGSDAAG